MSFIRRAISLTAVVCFCCAIARPETIHLKNNKSVEGKVISRSAESILLKTEHGDVPIPLARIEAAQPDTLKRAQAAYAEGKWDQAVKQSQILLFWEPKNESAKELLEKSSAEIEKINQKKQSAEMDDAARKSFEALQGKVNHVREKSYSLDEMREKLTSLKSEIQSDLEKYRATSQRERFEQLLQGVDEARGIAGRGIKERDEKMRKREDLAREATISRAREEQANGAEGGATSGVPIMTIARNGKSVDLRSNAVSGGVTMFDFYADWCGPCKAMAPHLEQLAKSTPGVYLRKIDIKDWQTPVAKQYKINSIPSVWIYDKQGRLVQQRLNDFNSVKASVDRALRE